MNETQVRVWMRREFNKSGWMLLVYYFIMNAAVTGVCIADALLTSLPLFFTGDFEQASQGFSEALYDALTGNGWGYVLAMVLGALLMLLWKGRTFCFCEIWKRGKTMSAGNLIRLLVIFTSGQAVFQVAAIALESLFSLFGMSVLDAIESASDIGDTLSMFLYACVFAPIGEEILFRGLILRSFQPFGKKFAILASSFLFGIFHGNIVQSPYAFAVGLVLGYTAAEYSIVWAIVLHMFNNLVLGDILPRITELLPQPVGGFLFTGLIWGCAIAAVVILIVNRKKIRMFREEGKIHPWPIQCFFSSPGVLALSGFMLMNVLLTLLSG